MKRLVHSALVILLGAVAMVLAPAVPFPVSVHAAVRAPAEIAEVAQELQPDAVQHHDDINSAGQFSPEAVQQQIKMYQDWQNQPGSTLQDPVDAVKAAAGSLGLNANTDTFYLTGKTASVATVHVVHLQKGYNVTLIPSGNGAWIAASITPGQ